jgi:hypothetical protein
MSVRQIRPPAATAGGEIKRPDDQQRRSPVTDGVPAGHSRDSSARQTCTEKESVMDDLSISKHGVELLRDPILNKSTAFTESERQLLGLVGLVPDATESEDLQLRRVMQQLGHKATDLDR